MYIDNSHKLTKIYITLGNKGSGFKESGFGIFLFINNFIKLNFLENQKTNHQDLYIYFLF